MRFLYNIAKRVIFSHSTSNVNTLAHTYIDNLNIKTPIVILIAVNVPSKSKTSHSPPLYSFNLIKTLS